MFLGKLNKMYLKKAATAIALAFVLEAALIPSLGSRFSDWFHESDAPEARLGYMMDVLSGYKTGLGSLEELKLAEVILVESVAHKIDPLFVLALIKTESTFYNWSKSFNGAVGLMQILPSTGRELAGELKLKWKGEETLLDPYTNVKMGVHYFSSLKRRFKDTEVSLAAYNIGPGQIDIRIREGDEVGQAFSNRVLSNYRHLKERAEFY